MSPVHNDGDDIVSIFIALIIGLAIFLAFPAQGATRAEIENQIRAASAAADLDPQLVLAIVEAESSFNPKARGQRGEVGLFQLRPEFHDVREGASLHNISVGIAYLSTVRSACSGRYGSAWFVCFNYGPYTKIESPKETEYYKRVIGIYKNRVSKSGRSTYQVAPHVAN